MLDWMTRSQFCLSAVVLIASVAQGAGATTIASTLGGSNSYNTNQAFDIHADVQPGGSREGAAMLFVVPTSQSYQLTSVELALGAPAGGASGSIDLRIASDVDGLPGQTLSHLPGVTFSGAGIQLSLVQFGPVLAAGESYWLIVEPAVLGQHVSWYYRQLGFPIVLYGPSAIGYGALWDPNVGANGLSLGQAAFRLNGNPVPEPSTAALLSLGGLLAGLASRRASRLALRGV